MVYPAGGIVNPLITRVPPPVLEQILDRRHTQHEHDRDHRDLLPERVNRGEPVQKHYENKVQVRHPVELFEKVPRQERQEGVLGGPNLVVGPSPVRVFLAGRLRRNRVVGHDDPVALLLLFELLRAPEERAE